jgi:putative oxidoreductase
MMPLSIRSTSQNKFAGSLRIALGALFVMTGVMKLVVPMLATAWSGQLLAAAIPFQDLARWTVPFVEVGVGAMLLLGVYARVASVVVVGIMAVATYVHVEIENPALFPLQPNEPVVPIVVIVLAAYVVWRGAGSWSSDLKVTQAAT